MVSLQEIRRVVVVQTNSQALRAASGVWRSWGLLPALPQQGSSRGCLRGEPASKWGCHFVNTFRYNAFLPFRTAACFHMPYILLEYRTRLPFINLNILSDGSNDHKSRKNEKKKN